MHASQLTLARNGKVLRKYRRLLVDSFQQLVFTHQPGSTLVASHWQIRPTQRVNRLWKHACGQPPTPTTDQPISPFFTQAGKSCFLRWLNLCCPPPLASFLMYRMFCSHDGGRHHGQPGLHAT